MSSGNAFASGAGGQRFKSWAGQIGQSCQGLTTAANFIQMKLCCAGAMTRKWTPPTRYTLRHNASSVMKDLVWFDKETRKPKWAKWQNQNFAIFVHIKMSVMSTYLLARVVLPLSVNRFVETTPKSCYGENYHAAAAVFTPNNSNRLHFVIWHQLETK